MYLVIELSLWAAMPRLLVQEARLQAALEVRGRSCREACEVWNTESHPKVTQLVEPPCGDVMPPREFILVK